MNKHNVLHSGYYVLACALVAYIPVLIIWPIFFYKQTDMGYLPQYALAWAFGWSIIVLIWGKALPDSLKTSKTAITGIILASFPFAFFLALIIVTLLIRVIKIILNAF